MLVQLSTPAIAWSTYGVRLSFVDEDGAELTVRSLTWTLTDSDGMVVNSREAVALPNGSSALVVLTGADLALGDPYVTGTRVLTVSGVYDSDLGSDLSIRWVGELVVVRG